LCSWIRVCWTYIGITLADLGIKVSGVDTNKETTKKLNQSIATIQKRV